LVQTSIQTTTIIDSTIFVFLQELQFPVSLDPSKIGKNAFVLLQKSLFSSIYYTNKYTSACKEMADIDDDLLALAGDASSDEEDDAPANVSRESSVAGKTAGKAGAKKGGGRKASRKQNDSEEEGEA
jgi:hypothetical protein